MYLTADDLADGFENVIDVQSLQMPKADHFVMTDSRKPFLSPPYLLDVALRVLLASFLEEELVNSPATAGERENYIGLLMRPTPVVRDGAVDNLALPGTHLLAPLQQSPLQGPSTTQVWPSGGGGGRVRVIG